MTPFDWTDGKYTDANGYIHIRNSNTGEDTIVGHVDDGEEDEEERDSDDYNENENEETDESEGGGAEEYEDEELEEDFSENNGPSGSAEIPGEAGEAAETGAMAGENAAAAGEAGATAAGEGAAVAGEGAALAGEGAAVAGEGAAVAGEAGAALVSNPWFWVVVGILLVIIVVIAIFIAMAGSLARKKESGTAERQTIIAIDPGHPSEEKSSYAQSDYDKDETSWDTSKTGANGGAENNGVVEREINQLVANQLKTDLESKGYAVVLTKADTDKFLSNRERGNIAKNGSANVIIKLHNDDSSGDPKGIVFYRSNATVIKSKSDCNTKECINEKGERYSKRKDETIAEDKELGDALLEAMKDHINKDPIKYSGGSKYVATTKPHPANLSFGYTYDIPTSTVEMSNLAFKEDADFIKNTGNQKKISKAIADGIGKYIPPTSGGSVGLCKPLLPADPGSSAGLVQLPQNLGTYKAGQPEHQWGTPETITMFTAVAEEWNKRHPKQKITITDISKKNGGNFDPPHKSHDTGVDFDLSSHTDPSFIMTDSGYEKEFSLELAKLFFDTKAIETIGYEDSWVISEITKYTKENDLPGKMAPWAGHDNHYHVRVKPGLYSKACGIK
jgi:N-acetylmuramoyl-L-alanine amidase